MCYDHLAGAVGVSVTEALIGRGLVREGDGGYLLAPGATAEFGRCSGPAWTGASAAITSRAAWAPP